MFIIFFTEKITFTNAPSPQEFTEGDTANIVCDVTSSPPPTVIWKYKGAKIQMEKDGKFSFLFTLRRHNQVSLPAVITYFCKYSMLNVTASCCNFCVCVCVFT